MSEFNIKGNVHAVNQQLGDHNQMHVGEQNVEINWDKLNSELESLEGVLRKDDEVLYKEYSTLVKKRSKAGLRGFLRNNFLDFSKSILSSLAAGSLIELMKILL